MNEQDSLREIHQHLKESRKEHPDWFEDIIHGASVISNESGKITESALKYTYGETNIAPFIESVAKTAAICIRTLMNLPETNLPNKFNRLIDGK